MSVQYNAALEKFYEELGLESLKSRQWYRKLCLFFKLKKNLHPSYLFDMIPKVLSTRTTRNHNNIPLFNVKHEYFRNSFFSSTVIEWNKPDNNIRNSESVSAFKSLNLSDQVLIVRLMCIILMELNYLQDYELG